MTKGNASGTVWLDSVECLKQCYFVMSMLKQNAVCEIEFAIKKV